MDENNSRIAKLIEAFDNEIQGHNQEIDRLNQEINHQNEEISNIKTIQGVCSVLNKIEEGKGECFDTIKSLSEVLKVTTKYENAINEGTIQKAIEELIPQFEQCNEWSEKIVECKRKIGPLLSKDNANLIQLDEYIGSLTSDIGEYKKIAEAALNGQFRDEAPAIEVEENKDIKPSSTEPFFNFGTQKVESVDKLAEQAPLQEQKEEIQIGNYNQFENENEKEVDNELNSLLANNEENIPKEEEVTSIKEENKQENTNFEDIFGPRAMDYINTPQTEVQNDIKSLEDQLGSYTKQPEEKSEAFPFSTSNRIEPSVEQYKPTGSIDDGEPKKVEKTEPIESKNVLSR